MTIATGQLSAISLTYANSAAWAVFTATNKASAGNLQANWDRIVSAVSAQYRTVIGSCVDEINTLNNVPAARVYNSTNQTIATAAYTALSFNSERFDTDTIHDTATNNSRLTCKTAGKYQITGNAAFAANSSGVRNIAIRTNGSAYIAINKNNNAGSATVEINISTLYELAVNDYAELMVYQDSASSLNVTVNANYSPEFMMVKVA